MTRGKPLVVTKPLSLLVIVVVILCLPPTHLHIKRPCNRSCSVHQHAASLPHPCNQCSFFNETCAIEWVECKMPNPATGSQIAKDVDTLHKTANPTKSATNLIHHHIAIVILIPSIMLTIVNTPQGIVYALTATPAAVITMTMTVATGTLPSHAMAVTMLAIMTFWPMPSIRLMIWDKNQLSMIPAFALMFCYILMILTIWNGTPIQPKIPITPFIFTEMVTVKIPEQKV